MNLLGLAACLVLASTASGQLPVTVPVSLAQPYVQGAANVITNATQAGANTVGAVANTINTLTTGPGQAASQGLTGLLSLGNTAVSGMAAAVNSTANVMAAGLPTFSQFNAALQNATGIATSNQVVGLTNMLANANGNLQSAGESALQSLGNQPGVAEVAAGFNLGMPALPPVVQDPRQVNSAIAARAALAGSPLGAAVAAPAPAPAATPSGQESAPSPEEEDEASAESDEEAPAPTATSAPASQGSPAPAMGPSIDEGAAPNNTATCSITLDSPPTTTVTCEPVLLKVTIEAPPKGGKPTGKVTFWSDGLAISPALDLVDGQAAYNYTGFMVGSHSVFATYSGGGACPLGVSASILRQVTPAKVSVIVNPYPGAQRFPNCDWRQQRFDVSVANYGPQCAAPTGLVNLYLIAGNNWGSANFSLPPTDPIPTVAPTSINTRFPAIGQLGQAAARAGNIFINTVTQATGSVMNRVQDSAIFRRLIGIGALLPPSIQTPGPSTVSINLMRQLMGLVPGPYSIIASYAGDQNFQPSYAGSNFAIDITCALPANPIG